MNERYQPIPLEVNLALISTLLWLSACGTPVEANPNSANNLAAPPTQAPSLLLPDATKAAPGEGFDYCKQPVSNNGEPQLPSPTATWNEYNWENQPSLDTITLSHTDIREPNSDRTKLNLLLVPIGYDGTLESRMQWLWKRTTQTIPGINIHVSWVNKNLPLPLKVQPSTGDVNFLDYYQLGRLQSQIRQIYPEVDKFLFVPNVPDYAGGSFAGQENIFESHGIAVGQNDYTLYIAWHESIGHISTNRYDAYERFYSDSLWDNTEITTNLDNAPVRMQTAVKKTGTLLVPTGNTCNGQPVFRFSGARYNLMMDQPKTNDELIQMINGGEKIWSDYQIADMNLVIAKYLRQHRPY